MKKGMETNETRKGKYSKIILKEKKLQKRRIFFLQTSNLHSNKQKYKSEKETLYFYYIK